MDCDLCAFWSLELLIREYAECFVHDHVILLNCSAIQSTVVPILNAHLMI